MDREKNFKHYLTFFVKLNVNPFWQSSPKVVNRSRDTKNIFVPMRRLILLVLNYTKKLNKKCQVAYFYLLKCLYSIDIIHLYTTFVSGFTQSLSSSTFYVAYFICIIYVHVYEKDNLYILTVILCSSFPRFSC